MGIDEILTFLFGKNPGGMEFPEATDAQIAVQASEREASRAKAELAAAQAVGPGAKRKLSPEETALQDLLNSPRGQNYGR